jgi:hypothetical protein
MIGAFAQYLVPGLFTVYLLVLVVYARLIMNILGIFFRGGRKQTGSGNSLWSIIGYALAILLLVVLLRNTAFARILSAAENVVGSTMAALHITQAQQVSQAAASTSSSFLLYYTLMIFGVIIVVSFVLFLGGLRTAYSQVKEERTSTKTGSAKLEAMKVLQKAAMDLKLTGDYQEVILNCYRQMCHVLSDRGFKITPEQTASEFSERVSYKLGLGGRAVKALTFLFEEARYSNHAIDDTRRTQAINQLDDLQRSLAEAKS